MNIFALALCFTQVEEPPIISRQTDFDRETPIVKAVRKVKASIVTIKNGSGIIITENGYILTAGHLAASSRYHTITLWNGVQCTGEVWDVNLDYDLAIIKIHAKKLAFIKPVINDLMVGESIIAIGNPHGFSNTVTNGIISAIDREIRMPNGNKLTGLIQTNAAINPGNSGGPLFNVNGELIGLNIAIREYSQGIAFSINAKTIKKYLERVK